MVGLAALQLTHRNDSAIGYFKTEQPYPCTFIVYNYLSQCKDFVIQVKFEPFTDFKTTT
ncbi:hypothetical protein VCHA29O37_10145 [Vibrio chagasii]|nr:hypothetical protein VCHA29O37_10145 [Vibrio chagasii]